MAKRIWRFLSSLGTADFLASKFSALVALLSGGGVTVAGWLEGLSVTVIATCAIAVMTLVFVGLNHYKQWRAKVPAVVPDWLGELQRHNGDTFTNCEVPLDGHSYLNCKFQNVTFVYNGNGAIEMQHNSIRGCIIRSNNPAINTLFVLLKELGYFREGLKFYGPGAS